LAAYRYGWWRPQVQAGFRVNEPTHDRDLNADLGEGFGPWRLGDDEDMLRLVTSANIACGFHAGDPAGLVRTCRAAAARDVRIGAQVGYRDLAGFGRRYSVRGRHSCMPLVQQCPTSNPVARCI
jgi:hypothetical protein